MARRDEGNHWPPDLAEFIAIVGECTANPFGLTVGDVVAEYHRWLNESWRYDGADNYPWRHPVLYTICREIRRATGDRKPTQGELSTLAGRQLAKWARQVEMGYSVPPVRKKITSEHRPPGQSQLADDDGKYQRRGMEMLAKIRNNQLK